jgi:L-threonylcarbamoyladenylate synthase
MSVELLERKWFDGSRFERSVTWHWRFDMSAKILKPTDDVLKRAASIIREGGLVAFPTETVYGLGANALDALAVAKIFEVKKRPRFDPIIVHIADFKDLEQLILEIDEKVKKLIQKFWPGPFTLVLPKAVVVPDIVTAGLETVAIRMPSHPVALKLIKEAKVPIAAPSANLFGYLSPTIAEHVAEQIGEEIDLIIDGGKCPIGIESTVLDLSSSPTVLRPGGLPLEEIRKVISKIGVSTLSKCPHSPGQLLHHYSPQTPLKLVENKELNVPEGIKVGFLAFKPPKDKLPFEKIEVLSISGDLTEAAANFFSCLHRLDKADLDVIYAEPVPEIGLGRAIMDRLRKAESIKNGLSLQQE